MGLTCKECAGLGKVPVTKERGGPICWNCGGHGTITRESLRRFVAMQLDYPSVYMGGPSPGNMKRALRIVERLEEFGIELKKE